MDGLARLRPRLDGARRGVFDGFWDNSHQGVKAPTSPLVVLLLVTLLSGCGSGDVVSTAETNISAAREEPLGHGSTTRNCTGVHFDGPGPSDWRSHSTWIGPLGISEGSRGPDFSRRTMALGRDGLYRIKTPTLVEGHRPVTISLSARDADRAGILGVSAKEVFTSVTYVPCPDRPRTTYPAGFVARDRRPISLRVEIGQDPARRLVVGRSNQYTHPPGGQVSG
jgi:hypothetical protein